MIYQLFLTDRWTSFFTMGATTNIVGNATTKAKPQACIQIEIIPSIRPTLKILITSDMIHDINNAIKKENTIGENFWGIIFDDPSTSKHDWVFMGSV